jgi:mono/diheme cytochrome c family protein
MPRTPMSRRREKIGLESILIVKKDVFAAPLRKRSIEMKLHKTMLAVSASLALFSSGMLFADQQEIGKQEFTSHCAGCHGVDGKGNGPFVEFLKTSPRSLTILAQENKGVFPYRRVYEVIDGTTPVAGHGTRDMPVWGERYAAEIVGEYGEYDTAHPQTVRCRILELVFFLSTLQER